MNLRHLVLLSLTTILPACGSEGPTGPEGPEGPEGPAGARGDPGPAGSPGIVATAAASYRYDIDSGWVPVVLPSDGTMGNVMDLETGARSSGKIDVGAPARLIVTGSAYLHNGDVFTRSFQCWLQLQPDGSAPEAISFQSYDSLAQYDNITWSMTTGIDVEPDTYNVILQCSTGLANSGGQVFHSDLTAVAYAQ